MSAPEQVTVTQADCDAAAGLILDYWGEADPGMVKMARSYWARHPHGPIVYHLARHRIAAEAESAKAIAELVEGLRAYLWVYDRGVGTAYVAPIIRALIAKHGGGE